MNDTFQCGDQGALVAYLYDECEPGERETIATHIKRCLACASEIDGLSATRQTLATWTPPEMTLGFQMTRAQEPKARVLDRPASWWSAPLPAWAQMAAALVIFAGGLSIGILGEGTRNPAREQTAPRAAGTSIVPSTTLSTASRDDLAQVERQLRAEIAQLRAVAPAPAAARVNGDTFMQDVKALLAQSEERQRRDFTLRMVDLASGIETQRRVDLQSVRQTMGQMQGVTGTEVRQQREAIDRINTYLINNVSQRVR